MKNLLEIASVQRCAIYNELSHIAPYYLTPECVPPIDLETELRFHKRNLFLLALTFDTILICTDNLSAFTRYLSKDVVSRVVDSRWFRKLLDAGVIVLCGWGADYGPDLMSNQIDYSLRYRPELKTPDYTNQLRGLARHNEIVLREPSYGERDHVTFLRKRIGYLEGQLTLDETAFLSDVIEETQVRHGFVGTMEIFPLIDDTFLVEPRKADAFFRAYYESWQEYCSEVYAPAITTDTFRLRSPSRTIKTLTGSSKRAISSLYSPDFFYMFLCIQFGKHVAARLLDTRAERLIKVRNGDWKVFVKKYHSCLETASEIAWIVREAARLGQIEDEKVAAEIIDYIFDTIDRKTDLASIGALLDVVIQGLIGTSVLSPIFSMFKSRINTRLRRLINKLGHREFEPFLRKLGALLSEPLAAGAPARR